MRTPLLFTLFIGLFVLGCAKEGQLTWTEKRMLGTWTYEKVKVYDDWSISGDRITDEYEGISITFYSDFSVEMIDLNNAQSFSGIWNITESWSDDESSNHLFASLQENESGELRQLILENLSVTKKRMSASFDDNHQRFNYWLRKQ